MRTIRLWAGRFAAISIGFLISLLLAEFALRIYNPIPLPLRGLEIVLPGSKRMVLSHQDPNSKLDSQIIVTTNSLGFRGPELPGAGTTQLKIIAVGGSTTQCVMLADEKAWPAKLSQRLNATFANGVWVNNAGLDGHSTFGHLRLLNQVILSLKPNYAIFLVGINDVGREDLNQFDSAMELANSGLFRRLVAESVLLSTVQVVWRSWKAFHHGIGHKWELDLRNTPSRPPHKGNGPDAADEQVRKHVPSYEGRLRRIISLTRQNGIEPILMTQPALYGDAVDPETGVAIGPLLASGKTAAQRWTELELYNQATRRVGLSEGVLVVDLAARIPKDSRLYYDWIHYTNQGAEQIAEVVASELVPFLQRREPKKIPVPASTIPMRH